MAGVLGLFVGVSCFICFIYSFSLTKIDFYIILISSADFSLTLDKLLFGGICVYPGFWRVFFLANREQVSLYLFDLMMNSRLSPNIIGFWALDFHLRRCRKFGDSGSGSQWVKT